MASGTIPIAALLLVTLLGGITILSMTDFQPSTAVLGVSIGSLGVAALLLLYALLRGDRS